MILFNEYRSWSESNQSNCATHGRKLARFSHAVYISRSEDGRLKLSEGFRVIFGEYSDIVENDIHTMQRFLGRLQIFVLRGLAGMEMKSCCCNNTIS